MIGERFAQVTRGVEQSFYQLSAASIGATKAVNRLGLMLSSNGDPVRYVVDNPGAFGFTIYPGEAWRYRGNDDWMEAA